MLKLSKKLDFIYGKKAEKLYIDLKRLLRNYSKLIKPKKTDYYSEKDTILITYGDFIFNNEKPLIILNSFVEKYLKAINTIHILPFYPYSSDRGFSVIDYKKVDPKLGSWKDITKFKKKLMFDLVLNHVSDKSKWFKEFYKGNPDYENFFISFNKLPNEDKIKKIVRPRASELFVQYDSKYLWRTFLNDQIDLNYQNPKVLLSMIDVMLFYVSKGAHYLRLDAIAYLWKELNTKCIHLKQTHIIVKILRDILDIVAPHVIIITETNVPYKESISYLSKNEAQITYNFTLPPMVLHTLLTGNTLKLSRWVSSLKKIPETTYLNFLDSHDGIGLRGVEGILDKNQINNLVERTIKNNGKISYRLIKDRKIPYEMNITWWSFLNSNSNLDIDKYIASRAIALSISGIPGIYLHGLLGSENDLTKTRHGRDINRKNLRLNDVKKLLADKNSKTHKIFYRYLDLIKKRCKEKAFHPDADQKILFLNDSVFSILREYQGEEILVLINVSEKEQEIPIKGYDIVSEKQIDRKLKPYQVCWLKR